MQYKHYYIQICSDKVIIRDAEGNYIMEFPTEEEAIEYIDELCRE